MFTKLKGKFMKNGLFVLGVISLAVLVGCGGGSSSSSGEKSTTEVATTTDVAVTVIDGAIQNAKVCLDTNNDGVCGTGEPTGSTDASGKVTLKVNTQDAGKYPVIAEVGTDAIDADTGKVPTAYTMKTPADKPNVVTPLTTLVQNVVASSGSSSADAEAVVKNQIGVNVSLFEDFSKGTTEDHKAAANVARLVVLTTQEQSTAVKDAVDKPDLSGTTITKIDLDKAIQKKIMEMLPQMVALLSDPGVQEALKVAQAKIDAASGEAKKAAQTEKDKLINDPATKVVASDGLTKESATTAVAVNKQQESSATAAAETPSAGFNVRDLSFTDAKNYFVRFLSSTVAQNTPDSKSQTRYVDNRYRRVNGGDAAAWNTGRYPVRQADVHWNGSTWAACKLNFENVSSVRDAKGNSEYDYCDKQETGKSSRATFSVAGKKMVDVLADAVKAGYTNFGTVNETTTSALGDTTFPDKSAVYYQSSASLTTAIGFYPGSGNWVTVETSTPCAAIYSEKFAATLQDVTAKFTGADKCSNSKKTITNSNGTFDSGDRNEGWGSTTIYLGDIGSAQANYTDGTAPSFYTTNTRLRASFGASDVATYYSCKQRYNGSTRNCDVIGTGKYSINTLGDAKTLVFSGLPAIASALTWTTVLVERGGKVYYGYQDRLGVFNKAGLNTVASTALLTQLGLPVPNPDVPLALTLASYQGTWDAYDDKSPTTVGETIYINASGQVSCQSGSSCSFRSFDPATGRFELFQPFNDGTSASVSGTMDFIKGTGVASYIDGSESGTAKLQRR